jgi:Phage integrase, N-terminal SAM-like domain
LRHTFAVNTLLGWYRAGDDVAARLPSLSTYLGHVDPAATYWYLWAVPELLGLAAERLERKADGRDLGDLTFLLCAAERRATRAGRAHTEGHAMSALAPTMQAFFTERLIGQRQASLHTIAAYGDTFRPLLAFAQQRAGVEPHALDIDDLDAVMVTAFLDHLERDRGNNPRTRNARLAAIRSLYRYAALRHAEHAATIARVLAIPTKRHDRAIVCWSSRSRRSGRCGSVDTPVTSEDDAVDSAHSGGEERWVGVVLRVLRFLRSCWVSGVWRRPATHRGSRVRPTLVSCRAAAISMGR